MSYFVTFYSYKGGVGRTLALANVAWLLANHPNEPARVLVIDFDLGAPGLFEVFKMSRAKTSAGVVDYIGSYLKNAAIPEIDKYIHKTAYKGIDIFPAGKMDHLYQRRFEAIDWKGLYDDAFGYKLIERLKADISEVKPGYDYVLVDSLTGFSDVGGICVKQLPDALVLLFRLNQQNLDGIGSVYRSAVDANLPTGAKPVVPVITPSWPFLDEAAGEWIERAQATFAREKLLEISFDSSLSFGERIISETASKHTLTSKLLVDYRSLAAHIRDQNPSDPLRIWQTLIHNEPSILPDYDDIYLRLLRRRPQNFMYWRHLPMAFNPSFIRAKSEKSLPSSLEALVVFAKEEADNDNKFALFALSSILPILAPSVEKNPGRRELDRAIEIDPAFSEARIRRGNLAMTRGQFIDAISDFKACLDLPAERDGTPHNRIRTMIADAYLRLFDAEAALQFIEPAIAARPSDIDQYAIRAKALYLKGDYASALADAQRFASMPRSHDPGSLLPALILAAMGRIDEASRELSSIAKSASSDDIWNLAEAYLAVDPTQTISLLKGERKRVGQHLHRKRNRPAIDRFLTLIARVFLQEDANSIATAISQSQAEGAISDFNWNVFEVVAMVRAKEFTKTLSRSGIEMAYQVIKSSVDKATASRVMSLEK